MRTLAPVAAQQERIGLRMNHLEKRLHRAQKGDAGPKGDPGPKGDIGPMPRHKWDGTKLAFEEGPDGGHFGPAVDLKGPPGESGIARTGRGLPLNIGIGGAGDSETTTAPQFSYFPAGWA